MFLIFGGCTTTQTVDPQYQAATQENLKLGDAVVVFLRDGHKLDLTFVEWTNDQLVGRDRADSLHTISRQDIAQLELSRISFGKAPMLVVALAGVAAGVLLAVA